MMKFRKWAIVKYLPKSEWVQFVSDDKPPLLVLYNGKDYYQTTNNVSPQPLPIGLTALGFVKVSEEGKWPATFRDQKGNQITEREPYEFFLRDKHIIYTHEVQEAFDLFFPIEATEGYEVRAETE